MQTDQLIANNWTQPASGPKLMDNTSAQLFISLPLIFFLSSLHPAWGNVETNDVMGTPPELQGN